MLFYRQKTKSAQRKISARNTQLAIRRKWYERKEKRAEFPTNDCVFLCNLL